MLQYLKLILYSILIVNLVVSHSIAQNPPVGIWETCQVMDYVQHFFLEFSENGEYRRIILSDNPNLPFYEEKGTCSVSGESITLRFMGTQVDIISLQTEVVSFQLSEDGNTLLWDTIPLERGRELSSDIFGTWGMMDPFSGDMAGQIRLEKDGTYEMTLVGSHEEGVFKTVGSGMVHWSTEIDNPELLGIPAIWTNIRVEGDQLSYDIACSFTVTAVRLAPTSIHTSSWGKIKQKFY